MEYFVRYPSSDPREPTDAATDGLARTFLVPQREMGEDLEHPPAEAEQLHRAPDEEERLAALDANRRKAEREMEQRNEKEQKLLAEIGALTNAEAEQRLNAEIKTLSQVATEQIDRMDEAKARLAVLEQIRLHAETTVCKRAEREIRLQAEIEALRRAGAAQLKRIIEAETEERRITEEQTRVQAAAQARLKAEVEARERAATEALQLQDEALTLAQEAEQRLEHLETIRSKAEAAAQQRAARERVLSSQLLDFGEAAAEQRERIEKAEADLNGAAEALQQLEEKARQTEEHVAARLAEIEKRSRIVAEEIATADTEARALAEKEGQRLAELEAIRARAEAEAENRSELERRLNADIEGLRQAEAAQLNRIADAEETLLAREDEPRAAGVGVSQEDGERTNLITDSSLETRASANRLQTDTSNDETTTTWSLSKLDDQNGANPAEELEWISDDGVGSPEVNAFEIYASQNSSENLDKSIELFPPDEGAYAASEETSILKALAERFRKADPTERSKVFQELARLDKNDAVSVVTSLFDDSSEDVRNAAARALYDLSTNCSETFTHALRKGSPERRRHIIKALDASGLAAEAIDNLTDKSREKTHDAFSMLFLMAKAGEVQSLLQAIETHPNSPVRLSVIKLLTLSNRADIIPALRSLAVRAALPIEVRAALMESIYEVSKNARERSLSTAEGRS